MSYDSPAVIIFDTDGYEVSVKDNKAFGHDGYSGLLIAGSDGYRTHHVKTDGYGRVMITGQYPDGYTPFLANPVTIAGLDPSGAVQTLQITNNGVLQNRYYELSTFNAIANNIPTAANKSLLSILNTSTKIVRIEEIYLVNVRTTAVTGVVGNFEIRRITGHSAGTLVTNVETYETSDVLDAGVTVRTNATVAGESANLLWRSIFSTDEHGIAAEDVNSTQHIFQTMFPIFVKKTNNSKTITLKQNEGLTIKFTPNSNTGLFDVFCIFTQE